MFHQHIGTYFIKLWGKSTLLTINRADSNCILDEMINIGIRMTKRLRMRVTRHIARMEEMITHTQNFRCKVWKELVGRNDTVTFL
jgi:hypothetical protein